MPRLADLELRRVGYGHPDALLLVEEVQAEYVARYGGPDESPIDQVDFEDPTGQFFVGWGLAEWIKLFDAGVGQSL